MDNTWYLKDIRNLDDNTVHERVHRRKGHEVKFLLLEKGHVMIYEYLDGTGSLRTSRVKNIGYDEDILYVTTLNTLYVFVKNRLLLNL